MQNGLAFLDRFFSFFHSGIPYLDIVYKAILTVLGALLLWLAFKRVIVTIEKRTSRNRLFRENTQIFQIFHSAFSRGLLWVSGAYLIRLLNIQFISPVFFACILLLMAKPVNDFMQVLLLYLEKNIADKTQTKIDNVIFELLNKFSGVIVYGTSIILALDIMGVNVMPFVAGAGVAGIAIGFAAKDTLSNLIAGVLLIIDRPFEVGDRIEVWSAPTGSASWGDVIDIGLRATKIRTTDNIIIIIPNNEIMMRDIVNYTIMTSRIRVRVNIGVAYDTDVTRAKNAILKVADQTAWILKDPAPKVVVTAFGESSVDLQLRVWIDDARKRMDTISHLTDKIKEAFDQEGIEIPYPKRDITIINKTSKKREEK